MVRLPKVDLGSIPPVPGWAPTEITENAETIKTAFVRCPRCRKLADLRDHRIDPSGAVFPSLVCPQEGCDFHDFVELLGWKEEGS